MSLRDQAALDVQSIINADFEDITLTDENLVEYELKGKVFKVDMQIDPDTGAKIFEPADMITVSLLDLTGTLTEEWSISTTDVQGNPITGQVRAPMFDHTLGFVTFQVEAVN